MDEDARRANARGSYGSGMTPATKLEIEDENNARAKRMMEGVKMSDSKLQEMRNTASMRMRLREMADCIDRLHRNGADEDKPEGARFISISDTAAREMTTVLQDAIDCWPKPGQAIYTDGRPPIKFSPLFDPSISEKTKMTIDWTVVQYVLYMLGATCFFMGSIYGWLIHRGVL